MESNMESEHRLNLPGDTSAHLSALIERNMASFQSNLVLLMQDEHTRLYQKLEKLLNLEFLNHEELDLFERPIIEVKKQEINNCSEGTHQSYVRVAFGEANQQSFLGLDDDKSDQQDPEEVSMFGDGMSAHSKDQGFTHSSSSLSSGDFEGQKLFPEGRNVRRAASFRKSGSQFGFVDAMVDLFNNDRDAPEREISATSLRESVTQQVGHAFSHPSESWRRFRYSLVQVASSSAFDLTCGCVIFLNTILIGIEVEFSSASRNHTDIKIGHLQIMLNVWYISEMALRIVAFGKAFFIGPDWRWNMFDLSLVFSVFLDMIVESLSIAGRSAFYLRLLRVARFFRIVRALRLYRQLRFFQEFRKMVYSIASSCMTLVWSFALLFFALYSFGVYVCANVSDYTSDSGNDDYSKRGELILHFGSLWKTIYTLFLCISTGANWGVYVDLLVEVDYGLQLMFVAFIFVVLFGALNVVMAVFVDSAMQSTQHYKDLMVQENQRNKELYMGHIREIFKQMDTDNSGSLSMQEMVSFLTDEKLQLSTYFEALELNAFDAHALFTLLDDDGSGVIDIEEFCAGCMRLKGTAKSFDVHCGIYDLHRLFRALSAQISRVRKHTKQQQRQTRAMEQKILNLSIALEKRVEQNIVQSNSAFQRAVHTAVHKHRKQLKPQSPVANGAPKLGSEPRTPRKDGTCDLRKQRGLPPAIATIGGNMSPLDSPSSDVLPQESARKGSIPSVQFS